MKDPIDWGVDDLESGRRADRSPDSRPSHDDLAWTRDRIAASRWMGILAGLAAVTFYVLGPELADGHYADQMRVAAYVALGVEGLALCRWVFYRWRMHHLIQQIGTAAAEEWAIVHAMEGKPALIEVVEVDRDDPSGVVWSCQQCRKADRGGPLALIDAVGHAIAQHDDRYAHLELDEQRAAILEDWPQAYRQDPDAWEWARTAQTDRRMTVLSFPIEST